ncbi:protein kinase [Nonomuraea sp. NPDC003804]|uniref:serine/threonine-protein kinase n=1 Tax=Nonomuraea sp. NPDC003804 TaxID=3154547 RepID=UPI0033BEB2AF
MNDDRLGPYRLLRRLGEGGMGVVHLAVDPQGRQVAVKVLRAEVAGDDVARRRLSREVDTMRRVRSKYIAEVLDADVTGHRPYIVTRYVPGRPLDEVVKQDGPLELPALVRVAHGVASALAAVHSVGVIHRDLKPGNVLILDGDPVLIDFGIAQAVDATRLTQTGMFIGTPGYLAPEIIEGQEAGPEVDIHAWAGTVLFGATGQPPFGKGTLEMIFYNITAGKAEVSAAPRELQPMLKAAFQRNPAKRPKAAELAEQTARLLSGLSGPARTPDELSTMPEPGRQGSRQVTDPADVPTPAIPPARPPLGTSSGPHGAPAPGSQEFVSLLGNQGGAPPAAGQGRQAPPGAQGPAAGGRQHGGGDHAPQVHPQGGRQQGPQPTQPPGLPGQGQVPGQGAQGQVAQGQGQGPGSRGQGQVPGQGAQGQGAQGQGAQGQGPQGEPTTTGGDPWPTRRVSPEELRQMREEAAAHPWDAPTRAATDPPASRPWPVSGRPDHHASPPGHGTAQPPAGQGGGHPAGGFQQGAGTFPPAGGQGAQGGRSGYQGVPPQAPPYPHRDGDIPTRRVRTDSPDFPSPYGQPYQGTPQQGQQQGQQQAHQAPQDPETWREPRIPGSRPGAALQRSKAYGVAGAMLLVIMIVLAVLAPVVMTAVVLPCVVLLRAADLAQPQLNARRPTGAAAADVIRVFGRPAALLKSIGITIALVPYALILGLPVTLLLTVLTWMPLPNALAWGAAIALWTVCAGPGVESPGRQMRRTLASLVPSRTVAMGVAGVLAVGAALSLVLALGTVPNSGRQAVWSPVGVSPVTDRLQDLRGKAEQGGG